MDVHGWPQLDDRPTEDARLLHASYAHVARTRSARGKAFKRLPAAACFRADVVHTFELSLGESYVDMRKWKVRAHVCVCVCVCVHVCVCVCVCAYVCACPLSPVSAFP